MLKYRTPAVRGLWRQGALVHVALVSLVSLASCSSLPNSGPTAAEITDSAADKDKNLIGFKVIDVSPKIVDVLSSQAAPTIAARLGTQPATTISRIGVGDALSVSVFSVFGAGMMSPSKSADGGLGGTGSGQISNIPPLTVDEAGMIGMPFAGQIKVLGKSPEEVSSEIVARLNGQIYQPQVVVNVTRNIANTVVVAGDIKLPGRYPVLFPEERLLDVIAQAGGPTHTDHDTWVRVSRGEQTERVLLEAIDSDPKDNVPVHPGDHIQISFEPRTFLAFGASDRITQFPFEGGKMSLAEAIARIGGPSDLRADPTAIFLFRWESSLVASQIGLDMRPDMTPVLYRVDMMNPSSYFELSKFPMRDKDIIYVANSGSNKVYKVLGIINSAFGPVGNAKSATN